jgi:type I restriction enzyme S subunit
MSKIDELIAELCPEGVSTFRLDEIFEIRGGFTPSKSDLGFWEDGTVPWFRMEDIRKNGRVLKSALQNVSKKALKGAGTFPANSIIVSTSATIGEHALITVPFLANQRFSVLTIKSGYLERLLPEFAFYIGFPLSYYCTQNTVKSGFAGVEMVAFRSFPIPLPPLEVQREIVEILDKFTQLEAELEAELEVRKSQYEHTRGQLLDFSGDPSSHPLVKLTAEFCPEGVEFKSLGELLETIPRGRRLTKAELPQGGSIPVFHGGLEPFGFTDQANTPAMTVMVINVGASAGNVGWSEKPFWCSDGCFALPHSNLILPKYLYYCALDNQRFFVDRVRKAGIPTLPAASVLELGIPTPPLEVQREIVSILDKLDALANDLNRGLPAEIAARRKQYEYYRDKLLTFKELDAE